MGRRFTNPWPHPRHGFRDVLKWKLGLGPEPEIIHPEATDSAEWQPIDLRELEEIPADGWQVFWLGHASFLLCGCGVRLLIDPVFSDYCAPFPFQFSDLKRLKPPPLAVFELPPIDAILLTHLHYDHCDLPTLRQFPSNTMIVVSEGHQRWLEKRGFGNVRELSWWSKAQLAAGVTVVATPAQHFTARTPWDRNQGHWCGWCIEGGGQRIWHAGDSGYCPAFAEIGARLGPMDFSMIPIGSYQPRWFMESVHMNPAEAVQVFQETRTQLAVAMHWGTFSLTDEPLGEPPLLLKQALSERGIDATRFEAGKIGQMWRVI